MAGWWNSQNMYIYRLSLLSYVGMASQIIKNHHNKYNNDEKV